MDFRLLRFRLRLKIIVIPSQCKSPKLHSEAARLTSCVYGSEEGLIQKVGEDR